MKLKRVKFKDQYGTICNVTMPEQSYDYFFYYIKCHGADLLEKEDMELDTREYYRRLYDGMTQKELEQQVMHDEKWLRLIHEEDMVEIMKKVAKEFGYDK